MTSSASFGAVTRVATFENFSEGDSFKPSFTDPLSGITFRNSTTSLGGFGIDYSSSAFGGSTYLTSGGYISGPTGIVYGANFGFTADLPALSNQVSIDVMRSDGDVSQIALIGLNSSGQTIAQQFGSPAA